VQASLLVKGLMWLKFATKPTLLQRFLARDDTTTVILSRRAHSPTMRQSDLLPASAVPPSCSTDNRIKLVRRAFQKQSVMQSAGIPRSSRRSDDGQTILRSIRIGPDLTSDLAFLVGATGFEPVTPRL
jgi:hypothetical protein